ncbi:MAG: hypothetical protein Q9192_003776 [Flavoplaca navasiana]
MSFSILLLLVTILFQQECTPLPLSPADQNPTAALVPIQNHFLIPRQTRNTSTPRPLLYPLPSNPRLTLRFTSPPSGPLPRRATLHAISALRIALKYRINKAGDRNKPLPPRISRANRYVKAEIRGYDLGVGDGDGPRDGKARTRKGKVLTLEEGGFVLGAMWEVMKVYGFRGRWGEVVDVGEGGGEDGERGGLVVGFVRVGGRSGNL